MVVALSAVQNQQYSVNRDEWHGISRPAFMPAYSLDGNIRVIRRSSIIYYQGQAYFLGECVAVNCLCNEFPGWHRRVLRRFGCLGAALLRNII